jgi:hypothetical protein
MDASIAPQRPAIFSKKIVRYDRKAARFLGLTNLPMYRGLDACFIFLWGRKFVNQRKETA